MATVTYQYDNGQTVGTATVQTAGDDISLGQAGRLAQEHAGNDVNTCVIGVELSDGRDLHTEWEDTYADEL